MSNDELLELLKIVGIIYLVGVLVTAFLLGVTESEGRKVGTKDYYQLLLLWPFTLLAVLIDSMRLLLHKLLSAPGHVGSYSATKFIGLNLSLRIKTAFESFKQWVRKFSIMSKPEEPISEPQQEQQ